MYHSKRLTIYMSSYLAVHIEFRVNKSKCLELPSPTCSVHVLFSSSKYLRSPWQLLMLCALTVNS